MPRVKLPDDPLSSFNDAYGRGFIAGCTGASAQELMMALPASRAGAHALVEQFRLGVLAGRHAGRESVAAEREHT